MVFGCFSNSLLQPQAEESRQIIVFHAWHSMPGQSFFKRWSVAIASSQWKILAKLHKALVHIIWLKGKCGNWGKGSWLMILGADKEFNSQQTNTFVLHRKENRCVLSTEVPSISWCRGLCWSFQVMRIIVCAGAQVSPAFHWLHEHKAWTTETWVHVSLKNWRRQHRNSRCSTVIDYFAEHTGLFVFLVWLHFDVLKLDLTWKSTYIL